MCHWVWAADGFLFNLGPKGAIDFAGGTVVHISAGTSGLKAVLYLGARHGYDDSLDAFGIHGIGGITGAILLVFFIRPSWMADAASISGGTWTIWNQLGIQTLAVGIAIVYAGLMTLLVIYVVDKLVKFKSC